MEDLKGELNSTSTYVPAQLTKDQLFVHHTPVRARGLSQECILCIPMRVVKGD